MCIRDSLCTTRFYPPVVVEGRQRLNWRVCILFGLVAREHILNFVLAFGFIVHFDVLLLIGIIRIARLICLCTRGCRHWRRNSLLVFKRRSCPIQTMLVQNGHRYLHASRVEIGLKALLAHLLIIFWRPDSLIDLRIYHSRRLRQHENRPILDGLLHER